MEPRIQYAKTSDGVSIAFWTLGEGMPFVVMPGLPLSHIEMEWQIPEARRWYERLGEKRMVVRYDARGTGLSEREAAEYSLDSLVVDLEAVATRLGLERFALFAPFLLGPAGIAYAARHAERVSHLVLWAAWARGSDFWRSSEAQALDGIREKDWAIYTETVGQFLVGWSDPDVARQYAALLRESITPEALREFVGANRELDVTALLPQVRSPTLVLHRRELAMPDVAHARGLASRIPGARLVLLEGTFLPMWLGDREAMATAIDEFLGESEETAATPSLAADDIHTILFTDVEGSTALTQRLGDAKAREVLREHERIVREALKAHGGSEVKTMGDGFMASFPSATKALECAIAMQRAFAEHNESAPEPIRVRIGLNAGEPIAEDDDLFG